MTKQYHKITRILGVSIVALSLLITGCTEYAKILKSSDYNLKFEKAKEYYNEGECAKALPLLEELLSLFRLTAKGEDVYYYYAQTNYCMGEYFIAGYYFKSFVKTYPGSPRAEECAFLGAMCNVKNSPSVSLDQSETVKAIDELQLFMDRYPETDKLDTCNSLIKSLRVKLETKALNSAKLYFKMEQYKAATITFKNVLVDYPDTQFKEEVLFFAFKSNYMLAINSIQNKKEERFRETIKSYHKFADAFPESRFLKEAGNMYDATVEELEELQNN